MLGRLANVILKPFGVRLISFKPPNLHVESLRVFRRSEYPDFSALHCSIIEKVYPYTMTSPERLHALIDATIFIVKNRIFGDVVECGVWRGGSMMAVAETLLALGKTDINLFLYDTFEGMSAPTEHDVDFGSQPAADLLQSTKVGTSHSNIWCYASMEDVRANLQITGYPSNRLHFIKGQVEDTLPLNAFRHPKIAMLRLDTDWYASTKVELEVLYNLVAKRGFIIIDDYGHWRGARKAVDEFCLAVGISPILHRLDYTGRLMQKN